MLLWIQFYKLDLVLITLPLSELRKVAENHRKYLALIINPLVYREIHSDIVNNYVHSVQIRIWAEFLMDFCNSIAIPLAPTYSCHSISHPVTSLHVTNK